MPAMSDKTTIQFCGVCFFELPPGASSLEHTGVLSVSENEETPPSILHDLQGSVQKQDVTSNKAPYDKFFLESLQKSNQRGCSVCGRLYKLMLQSSPDLAKQPAKTIIQWHDGRLRWELPRQFGKGDADEFFGWQPSNVGDFYIFIQEEDNINCSTQGEVPCHPFLASKASPTGQTSSDKAFERVRRWINTCEDSHKLCNRNKETGLPKRVIVIDDNLQMKLQVQETEARIGQYACLSYCWGSKDDNFCLTNSNLRELEDVIPESRLPKLFKDVVGIVKRLGLNYLWIDSLCIIPDNEADWQQEAAAMNTIYANAHVTIAATGNSGPQQSLFHDILPEFQSNEITKVNGKPIMLQLEIPHPWSSSLMDLTQQRETFPLLTRGWVYQERILSGRVIHFTKCELQWECRESKYCECRHMEYHYSKQGKFSGEGISWTSMVQQFTALDLSRYKDRLPAVSGLAKRYCRVAGKKYIAGLWVEDLEWDLYWSRRVGSRYGQLSQLDSRPKPRVAPTWSWASIKNVVSQFERVRCDYIEFLGHEIDPAGPDEYGELRSAQLKISGPLVPAKLYYGADFEELKTAAQPHPFEKVHPSIEKPSRPLPVQGTERSKDADLSEDDFALLVRGNWYLFTPDYAMQKSGEDYIKSGEEVQILLLGADTAWGSASANRCIVLHCVDPELKRFERIGSVVKRREVIREQWRRSRRLDRQEIILV